jgi:sugar phosphate isomerase/epimerase
VPFLSAIRATGYDGPIGVEVISEQHRTLPLVEAAHAAFDAARTCLEAEAATAGSTPTPGPSRRRS